MKLTREAVFKLQYDPNGPETQQAWGTGEDKNLGVALSSKGDHVWIIRAYVLQPDQTTKKRIGRLFRRPLTIRDKSLDEARRERDIWKVEAAQGIDPIEKRRPQRTAAGPEQLGPATVAILVRTLMEEHVYKELEQGTWSRYGKLLRHIERHLGDVPTAELNKTKLNAFRRELAGIRETFNKARKLLGAAYKLADRLDWSWAGAPMVPPGFNPVLSVLPYDTAATRREGDPFEPEEVEAIVATAQEYLRPEGPRGWKTSGRSAIALPLFLLFTGLRKDEAMGLTWVNLNQTKSSGWRGWIDRRRNVVKLRHHKTSRKKGARVVPLSPQALKMLDLMVGEDEIWAFPAKAGGRLIRPEFAWKKLQEKAGVRTRGLHQTRHTFITRALEAGAPIGAIAKAVGHTTTYITEVYGHVSDRAARAAAEMASNEMHHLNWDWLQSEVN